MIRQLRVVALVAILAMVGVGLLVFNQDPAPKTLRATFSSTTSLYEGAQVKVMGVQVGKVTDINVKGTAVEVEITYDRDVKLPEDVHAIVVPPSVVGDRFIQLAPAYLEGKVMADGATLGLERTGVPLELDDTYRSLDEVASALGPEGANKNGALSRLVSATARNLDGRGRLLNSTIRELAGAINTLSTSSGDINATTTNFARLTKLLSGKDDTMRALVTNLAVISAELNGQGAELSTAVNDLEQALGDLARFTRSNKAGLTKGVKGLTQVSTVLASHVAELEEISDLTPVGLVNLMNTYIATNWDPERPNDFPVEGRTGTQALRADVLDDLDITLSYALRGVCGRLTPAQKAQLLAVCTALETGGASLGSLLSQLATNAPQLPLAIPKPGAP